jgi:hypothetical protein
MPGISTSPPPATFGAPGGSSGLPQGTAPPPQNNNNGSVNSGTTDNPNHPPLPPPPPAPGPPPGPPGGNDPRSNEPLPKQLATNAVPWTTGLVHGYMKTTSGQNQGGAGDFFVYFLFNPLQIQQGYGFTDSVLPQILQPGTDPNNPAQNTDIAAQSAAFQNQSIQFQIEFDRTYDVWEFMIKNGRGSQGRLFGQDSPGRSGVMWDIRAIERLIGLYDAVVTNPTGQPNPQAPAGQAISPAVDVFFGGPGALSFRGYFTDLDVELQRFNQYMVPVHAAVNITLVRIYQPPDGLPVSTPNPAISNNGAITGGGTTPAAIIGDSIKGLIGGIDKSLGKAFGGK